MPQETPADDARTAGTDITPLGTTEEYVTVAKWVLTWVVAVILAMRTIDVAPAPVYAEHPSASVNGYTWSLLLLYLPLGALVHWYRARRDRYRLRPLMRAVLWNVLVLAPPWIALDIFFANRFFEFPDSTSRALPEIYGYSWRGSCETIWMLWNPACYSPSIPLEEILFYIGGAGVLIMTYMWATEEWYAVYSWPLKRYTEEAKKVGPLVDWNVRFIYVALALLAAAILVKKFGWHSYHDGWPYYFAAELVMVFAPLAALYNRVRTFTNPRAFLFVLALHILVSLLWEATLALPYGWWNYQMHAMMGVVIRPWSNLPIEASVLWLSVGWGATFVYEATKIKVLTGKSWPEVLFGTASWTGLWRGRRANRG